MKAFISYSFKDKNKFEDVTYALEHDDIEFWKVDEIAAGQSLRRELQNAIRTCAACIFVATHNSLESGWCQAEIGAFWGAGKPVVVYLAGDGLSEADLPKQFQGDKFATSIREVVSAMKMHLSEAVQDSQPEAAYDLAIESFLDKLVLQFRTNHIVGFGGLAPGLGRGKKGWQFANAFGKEIGYDPTKEKTEAEAELRALVTRISELRRNRDKELIKVLLDLFTQVQGQAQSISHHLSRISYGLATLDGPWRHAQESVLELWKKKGKDLTFFSPYDLDRLRQFLEAHPAYRRVYVEEKSTIESFLSPGALSLDELIEITRAELEKSAKALSTAQ